MGPMVHCYVDCRSAAWHFRRNTDSLHRLDVVLTVATNKVNECNIKNSKILLSSIPSRNMERIENNMASRSKRTRRNPSAPTENAAVTVTVAHEPGATCDTCAQPRPVLIEQEGGAWMCEVCLGIFSYDEFWRVALINGAYSLGDGDL